LNSLVKFAEFVSEIKAENGRLYKQGVLEKYKDDEDVKYYLNFVFNPFITTGIGEKSYQRFHNKSCIDLYPDDPFSTVKDALEYLKVHNTGDYETQELMFSKYITVHLQVIKKCHCDQQVPTVEGVKELSELFYSIITKNLQLGVDAKTINKVIPGLIPTFSVMLANKYFDNPAVVEGKEFALTTKIDGSRIVAVKENGKVEFFTRQGQAYVGLVDLQKELEDFEEDNFVFDGELVAIETALDDTYKNTMKLSRTKEAEKHGLKMLVFDYLPIEDFKTQSTTLAYHRRNGHLQSIFYQHSFKFFEVLPILYCGTDTSKIIEILDEQVDKGEEGIMINLTESSYVFGRTNALLKVKKFQDMELKVIGFEEGINKLQGTLGALICEYKNNTVKCGSGFSDELRQEIWANQEAYLGKQATIKYFSESYDSKTGLPSLRFPIFMRFRED